MKIEGASALVTGGASGLGEATVRMLVARGARVMIVDRDGERAAALAAELGAAASFSTADVADGGQAAAAVAQASEPGPLRIAVNCAGIGGAVSRVVGRDGAPHDLEAFKRVIGVNLIGTFNMLRLAAAAIAKTATLEHGERGVIVNTASIAAFDGQIGQIAYSASKGGVVGLTLPAARDLSSVGIRVMTIAPGIMDTPMLAKLPEPARKALGESVVFPKRLGMPAEYAALVEQIISNGYLNGEVIRLDGSLRMAPK
jgi:NAD(P)-dependent dehydrogenase (short-subunit alcohol dehydrogenase family)